VRVLLDENFPLPLCKRLRAEGFEVEHIIELGLRAISDAKILARLREEELLFLTQDKEFLGASDRLRATILVSHVNQARPIAAPASTQRTPSPLCIVAAIAGSQGRTCPVAASSAAMRWRTRPPTSPNNPPMKSFPS